MAGDLKGEGGVSLCWLCGRPLGAGIEWHHPLPRSRGGRQRVAVHPICHRAIHAHFTNTELARLSGDVEALRSHEDICAFLGWIANKPPDFHAPTHGPVHKGRRRR